MWAIGALSFLNPLALTGLAVLPLLWWLLRLTPPAPRTLSFPPMMILLRLLPGREISTHSPPWLVLLRLALLLAIIFAAADPVINPAGKLAGTGPLTLIVDNGWAAAKAWKQRRKTMTRLIEQAGREGRPVILAPTAKAAVRRQVVMNSAPAAAAVAAALLPKPWPTDRGPVLQDLKRRLAALPPGQIVWLSDGLGDDVSENQVRSIAGFGALNIYADRAQALPVVLYPPVDRGARMEFPVSRIGNRGRGEYRLLARDADGVPLDGVDISFKDGETRTQAILELPNELRNRLTRLEIEGQNTVGSVLLMDERWARRPVGLVLPPGQPTTDAAAFAQPLLSPLYYLQRALQPVGDVRSGSLRDLMRRPLAMLVLADYGRLRRDDRQLLTSWMTNGGVLLRFAGPTMANAVDRAGSGGDGQGLLLPAPVRGGARTLGGVLSWSKPVRLAPFDEDSPFYGIPAPAEVTVKRQLLARPETAGRQKVWARLADGTPLISAVRKGRGWLVLVATTADPRWSNLALSGLLVSLLERLVGLSQGIDDDPAGEGGMMLSPLQTLDGFAGSGPPPPQATAIMAGKIDETTVGPTHPPGFYGKAAGGEGSQGGYRRALNLSSGLPDIKAFPDSEFGNAYYGDSREMEFRPWLLLAALVLAMVDLAAVIWLKGLFRRGTAAAALFMVFFSPYALAGTDVPAAALQTSLAYYITGDAVQDAKSRAGLEGLSVIVNRRTAAVLTEPTGIDPETDELAFYPLIYWPLGTPSRAVSDEAADRINRYLKNGGTILFDTLQGDRGGFGLGPMARRLDIPPLIPAAADHVLGRAFYLMKSFPGRWAGGRLWVESTAETVNDGVSSVIVGGNDWAAAWAMDNAGRPLYALVPGGRRQRELSFRFGVNLVMYVLTGNYKSDQVHLPSIIERLRR